MHQVHAFSLLLFAKVNQFQNIQNNFNESGSSAVPPYVNVCKAKWYPINTMDVLDHKDTQEISPFYSFYIYAQISEVSPRRQTP
jgi:hypothetical protein